MFLIQISENTFHLRKLNLSLYLCRIEFELMSETEFDLSLYLCRIEFGMMSETEFETELESFYKYQPR